MQFLSVPVLVHIPYSAVAFAELHKVLNNVTPPKLGSNHIGISKLVLNYLGYSGIHTSKGKNHSYAQLSITHEGAWWEWMYRCTFSWHQH
jgi:hypothetical protein